MHLYVLANISAHPIPSWIRARGGTQAELPLCTLQIIDQEIYEHVKINQFKHLYVHMTAQFIIYLNIQAIVP